MISICKLDLCQFLRGAVLALLCFALAPAAHAEGGDMNVYIVTYIDVQPAATTKALTLLRHYRAASRKEEGNKEVDLGQEIDRTNRFVLIETWRDTASFETHGKSASTTQFHDALKTIHRSPYDQRVAHGFAVGPTSAGPCALYVVTHVDVTPPNQAPTEILLRQLAEESRKNSGSRRYDILQQSPPRTNHFAVVAFWQNRKLFEAHEETAHRLASHEKLAPMLGALYDERLYKPLD